jgi:hypothetical protein
MQRNFRVIVSPEQLCSLDRNSAVAERGSFGAAGDDADVLGHIEAVPVVKIWFSEFGSQTKATL